MKRVNFFSGQMVQKEDLNYMQAALGDEIKSRTANQYSKGVVSDVDAYVNVDSNNTIRVYPFKAYTESGEQVYVPEDVRYLALDLTDSSKRELGTQGLLEDKYFGWEVDVPYIICAKYIEEGARPRPNYRTREPFATRIYSGFKFYAMREGIDPLEENGVNPFIVLAKAIYTNEQLIVTTKNVTEYAGIDAARVSVNVNRDYTSVYDISGTVSLDQHVKCIGNPDAVNEKNPHGITAETLGLDTNAVPEHERVFHAPGFIRPATSVDTCFDVKVDRKSPGIDFLTMYNLSSDENLHYNGVTIKSYLYPSYKVSISLSDQSGAWIDGTYTLFINLRTRELGIATDNQVLVNTRTFSIIYNNTTQYVYSPVLSTSLDTTYQYILYKFKFSHTKTYTSIPLGDGLLTSNFVELDDYRMFGSISANNLQKTASGDFITSFPIKATAFKFYDGSELTSAVVYPPNFISTDMRLVYIDGQTISITPGSCKDTTNKKTLTLGSAISKVLTRSWSSGSSQGCLPPGKTLSEGTWHIFLIGKENGLVDVAADTSITATNLIETDTNKESPIVDFRYFRRIGSVYVSKIGDKLSMRNFITIPSGGNGITTLYNDADTADYYINMHNNTLEGKTILGVPSMTDGTTNFENITVKMNFSSSADTTVKEHLFIVGGSQPVVTTMSHTVGVGDMELHTYDGKLTFSNTDWSGRVISYFDPRVI